jgi:hypothetical protein
MLCYLLFLDWTLEQILDATGVGNQLVKMRLLEFECVLLIILSAFLVFVKAEIYIVTVEGEPIISYSGGIDEFEATAVESDEKIDTTRYLVSVTLNYLVMFLSSKA